MRTDSLSRIWTVARRELKALADHPTGYVLLIVFAAVNSFLFFRQIFLFGTASLRSMLDMLPWVFLFFVPAVSMRTLAEDTRGGVLEVVLTQPLTELELLLGKYLGAVFFLWIGLALTLPIPLGLTLGAKMQWGPVIAQYVGAAMLACGLSGIGVWASSLARSQITAFILAVAVMFVFVLVGLDPLLVGLPPTAAAIAARLGVLSHFDSIGRGVIDLRDVIYFVSLAGVFLAFAYGTLSGRKLARAGRALRELRTVVVVATAIVLVVNLLGGYVGGRLDLSPGRAYTLSKATSQLVRNLDDIVTVKEFASDELPTSVALMKRELDDMLRDLRSASHGKVRVVRYNVNDAGQQRDAQQLGIQAVQFNVVGAKELQVKEGYLGLAVQYGAEHESIPFVNRTDDLEFRLASAIRGLARNKKLVIGVVTGAKSTAGFGNLRQALSKSYEIRDIGLADSTQPAPDVAVLLLAGTPDMVTAATTERYKEFIRRGGGVLVLANGVDLSDQMPMVTPRQMTYNDLLSAFGVSVHSDVAYDLASNELIPGRNNGPFQVMQRYPFFVRTRSTAKSTINKDLTSALLPWPSTLDTAHVAGWTATPLFVTTPSTGVGTGETLVDPSRDYPRTNLAQRLLAVQVAPANDTSKAGRLVVVGNETFIADNISQHAPENLAFAVNAIDWLAQDASLIAIRSRDTRPPQLAFASPFAANFVKYLNVIGVPALVAIAGIVHLARRRRKTRTPHAKAGAAVTSAAAAPMPEAAV